MKPQSGLLFLILGVSTLLRSFTTSQIELQYITPAVNSQCSKRSPCLTLEQLINSNVTKTLPDLSLMLLPGNHSLSSELTITNISSFRMMSSDSGDVSVTCNQVAKLTFVGVGMIEIEGVKFFGCGGNTVSNVNSFILVHSAFNGDNSSTTALILNDSSAAIRDSQFISNTVGMDVSYNNTSTDGDYKQVNVSIAGAMRITDRSDVNISRCFFDGNVAENGGALFAGNGSTVVISACTFTNTRGTVIYAIESVIEDEGSVYKNNTAFAGAVVYALLSNVSFLRSRFYRNKAEFKGGVILSYKSHLILDKCEAINNSANNSGVVNMLVGKLEIRECTFYQNSAQNVAGILNVETCSRVMISDSEFNSNSAESLGIFHTSSSNLYLMNTTIMNNSDNFKGVIHAQDSVIDSTYYLEISNNVGYLSVVYLVRCNASFHGTTTFENNSASFMMIDSNVTFVGNNNFKNNNNRKRLNKGNYWSLDEGGAVSSFLSLMYFDGETRFIENYSGKSGGAIFATESIIYFYGMVEVHSNVAEESGGGIYLYRTSLFCQGDSYITQNTITNNHVGLGGGIHAISSSIMITEQSHAIESDLFDRRTSQVAIYRDHNVSELIFVHNSARLGGGLYLDAYSKVYLLSFYTRINFTNNWAELGGAIFVNDNSTESVCASKSFSRPHIKTECFIQRLPHNRDGFKKIEFGIDEDPIVFNNNTANITGSVLYGGLLDRCTVSQLSDIYYEQYTSTNAIKIPIEGIKYFKMLSNRSFQDGDIASEPVRICFCEADSEHNCSYHPPPFKVMKGQEFYVTLAAVNQVNQSVRATIYSSVSPNGDLGVGQREKIIDDECTNVTYNVKSLENYETIKIHAEGPCHPIGISTVALKIIFTKCTCPTGFQVVHRRKRDCECECHSRLRSYLSNCSRSNSLTTTTIITRKSNNWIGYFEKDKGYLIYPHCPFDYCLLPSSDENINLTFPNGSDSQCAFHRSGLLCGSCLPNFSLSIGSSKCLRCNKAWPTRLLGVLLYGIIFGIILVTVILALDLTVATGTINGMLFYANVVSLSSNIFFQSETSNILTIAISWMNVTIGFDTCFIDGLDTEAKTWLGLVFPAYVFVLIIILIQLSKCSPKFGRLLGKGNPIAVLATLILLFYTKLLRNTIKIFSFAVLHYPNGSVDTVWRPDAKIKYFRGSHIPLVVVGIVIVVAVLIYTLLFLSWQWLLRMPNRKMFKFVRNTRLSLFVEANLAPYKPKYRFWMGLLLLVRIVLHLAPAFNLSNSSRVNLLVVGVSVTTLIVIRTYFGRYIYKRAFLDYLELTYLFNIVLLTIATAFYSDQNSKQAATYTSVSIALLIFVGIVVYHVVQLLRKCKCLKTTRAFLKTKVRKKRQNVDSGQHHLSMSLLSSQEAENSLEISTPTSSIVGLSPQHTLLKENRPHIDTKDDPNN